MDMQRSCCGKRTMAWTLSLQFANQVFSMGRHEAHNMLGGTRSDRPWFAEKRSAAQRLHTPSNKLCNRGDHVAGLEGTARKHRFVNFHTWLTCRDIHTLATCETWKMLFVLRCTKMVSKEPPNTVTNDSNKMNHLLNRTFDKWNVVTASPRLSVLSALISLRVA